LTSSFPFAFLSNRFGIFTSAAGAKIAWWLDPTGAMIISFAIIFSWSRTAYQQFRELAGVGAPPEFLRLITYNAMLHHEHIEKLVCIMKSKRLERFKSVKLTLISPLPPFRTRSEPIIQVQTTS